MTAAWYWLLLAFTVGAWFGWLLCVLFMAFADDRRRGGTLDLTLVRGELDLDWSDPRGRDGEDAA